MTMFSSLNRLWRDRRGVVAVEMATAMPILALLLVGTVEVGRFVAEANAVERGLRAGVMFAARSPDPLQDPYLSLIKNVVKTGNPDGLGELLAESWAAEGAHVDVLMRQEILPTTTIQVVRLEATVPYEPIFAGVAGTLGLDNLEIRAAHEQAHVTQ